jgi:SAM-dependent methyltransferase
MQRERAFAQDHDPSVVDRFGVWLSARQIRRWVPSFKGKRVADLGCGYHAAFMRTILDEAQAALLLDVAIAPDLEKDPRAQVHLGPLAQTLQGLPDRSLDVVLAISVLEHVWEPLSLLESIRRLLAPGGQCLINVPSWKGKRYLERGQRNGRPQDVLRRARSVAAPGAGRLCAPTHSLLQP